MKIAQCQFNIRRVSLDFGLVRLSTFYAIYEILYEISDRELLKGECLHLFIARIGRIRC